MVGRPFGRQSGAETSLTSRRDALDDAASSGGGASSGSEQEYSASTKTTVAGASSNKGGKKGRHNEQMLYVFKKKPVISRITTEEDQVSSDRLKDVAEQVNDARDSSDRLHVQRAFIAAWLAHRYRLTDDLTEMISKDQIKLEYHQACSQLKIPALDGVELFRNVRKEWESVPFRKLGGRLDWKEFFVGVIAIDSPFIKDVPVPASKRSVSLGTGEGDDEDAANEGDEEEEDVGRSSPRRKATKRPRRTSTQSAFAAKLLTTSRSIETLPPSAGPTPQVILEHSAASIPVDGSIADGATTTTKQVAKRKRSSGLEPTDASKATNGAAADSAAAKSSTTTTKPGAKRPWKRKEDPLQAKATILTGKRERKKRSTDQDFWYSDNSDEFEQLLGEREDVNGDVDESTSTGAVSSASRASSAALPAEQLPTAPPENTTQTSKADIDQPPSAATSVAVAAAPPPAKKRAPRKPRPPKSKNVQSSAFDYAGVDMMMDDSPRSTSIGFAPPPPGPGSLRPPSAHSTTATNPSQSQPSFAPPAPPPAFSHAFHGTPSYSVMPSYDSGRSPFYPIPTSNMSPASTSFGPQSNGVAANMNGASTSNNLTMMPPAVVNNAPANTVKQEWASYLTMLDESLLSLAPFLSSSALSVSPASFFGESQELRDELLDMLVSRPDFPRWPSMVFAKRVREKGERVWNEYTKAKDTLEQSTAPDLS